MLPHGLYIPIMWPETTDTEFTIFLLWGQIQIHIVKNEHEHYSKLYLLYAIWNVDRIHHPQLLLTKF